MDEGNRWLPTALVLYLGILALVPAVLVPRGKRFEKAFEEARSTGEVTPALAEAFDDPAVALTRRVELVAMVVVIVLMVAKPF